MKQIISEYGTEKKSSKKKLLMFGGIALASLAVVMAVVIVVFSVHVTATISEPIGGADIPVALGGVYPNQVYTGTFEVPNSASVVETSSVDWLAGYSTIGNYKVEVSIDNNNFYDLVLTNHEFDWQPGTNTVYYKVTYLGTVAGDQIDGNIHVNGVLQS